MLDQNDQERFMRLWTATQPSVACYVHSLVRDRQAAEDITARQIVRTLQNEAKAVHSSCRIGDKGALGITNITVDQPFRSEQHLEFPIPAVVGADQRAEKGAR